MSQLQNTLTSVFPQLTFVSQQPLAQYSTVRIGGPAEVFCQVSQAKDLAALTKYCIEHDIPCTVLGWGANTLISDNGVAGLVIRNNSQRIEIKGEVTSTSSVIEQPEIRWQADDKLGSYKYSFEDLDYDETQLTRVSVEIDAGVPLAYAINYLLQHQITGLQWYARIPATIGGAVYNNIHGGTHFLSEVVTAVQVLTPEGNEQRLLADQLEFAYDYSRFHHSRETILSVEFSLFLGDTQRAQQVVHEWGVRKAKQPAKSLGCIFQNISVADQQKLNLPTPSVGYIIEHVLGRKGWRVGDAQVSDYHAAFIENVGQATASDYLHIIKTIIAETKQKLGIVLKPEIFFIGFSTTELEGIV